VLRLELTGAHGGALPAPPVARVDVTDRGDQPSDHPADVGAHDHHDRLDR
jgi:hypothetical protein